MVQAVMAGGTSRQDVATQGAAALTQEVSTQDFLRLLTTQLRYQNPFEPMKETEFVTQLAQFGQLEATRAVQYLLQRQWESQQRLQWVVQAAALLGRQVRLEGGAGGQGLQGTVERVRLEGGDVKLVVAGQEYPLQAVVEVL